SGDVIDLSTNQLACSTITLTNGAITESFSQLTFQGPTDRTFTITNGGAGSNRRIIKTPNDVNDELSIYHLTITGGYYHGAPPLARGGCIYAGAVKLTDVSVTDCYARTYDSHLPAFGGGIFTNYAFVVRSRVTGNKAYSLANAYGGGIYSTGLL